MGLRRLLALSTVAAIAAAAAPGFLPVNVYASATDLTLFFTSDTNGDNANGIAHSFPDGTGTVMVSENVDVHYDEIDAAPVGEAIAYTKYVGDSIGLYVDNRALSAPHLVYSAHLIGGNFAVPYYPSFSPDGRTLLFSVIQFDQANNIVAGHLETAPVGGGAAVVLDGTDGLYDASFSPVDGARIAASRWAGGAVVLGTIAGAHVDTTTVPSTAGADFARFSPDGSRLSFVTNQNKLVVAGLDGTVLTTVTGGAIQYPVWQDAGTLLFTMQPTGAATSDIYRLDSSSTTPVQITSTPSINEWALATPRATDPAPGAPTHVAAALDGSHPTISWTPPIDADISRIVVRRTDGSTPPSTILDGTDVPAGPRSAVDTAQVGQTYSYSVFAVDAAGQVSTATSLTLGALAAPTVTAPAQAWVGATRSVPVRWSSPNGAGTHYSVTWASAAAPHTWHTWLANTTATSASFGASGRPVRLTGGTYVVRVSAVDAFGHATVAATATTVVPRDDSLATYSRGWTRGHAATDWLGSDRRTTIPRASFTVHFTGSHAKIIGLMCQSCGKFHVYVDGHDRGIWMSGSHTTKPRAALYSFAGKLGAHTITVVNIGTKRHGLLEIDAFAVS
jgi:hypothetical protein